MVTAAQHNITIVYITTLNDQRDDFDLKAIPSQKDITAQPFLEYISVRMLNNSTIPYQIVAHNALLKSKQLFYPANTYNLEFYQIC